MTDKTKNNTTPLTVASVFSLIVLFVSASALRDDNISQKLFIWALCLSIVLGLFSFAGYIETAVKSAWGFGTFRWVFAAGIAFIGFLARIDAVNDINAIFHIDAVALPMTTIAGTAMRFATYMYWPMVVVFSLSVLMIALMFWGTVLDDKDDIEKIGLGVRVFSAALASGMAWAFIHAQLSEVGISSKLYRIAHTADFVNKFNCQNIDAERFDALFIGPEQRRVLLAPKIESSDMFNARKQPPEVMQPINIPTYFPITDCSPGFPPSAS